MARRTAVEKLIEAAENAAGWLEQAYDESLQQELAKDLRKAVAGVRDRRKRRHVEPQPGKPDEYLEIIRKHK